MRVKLTAIGPNIKIPIHKDSTWKKDYPFKNPCYGEARQFPMVGRRFIVSGDTKSDNRTTSIVISVDKPTSINDNPVIRFKTSYTIYEMEWLNDTNTSTF